MQPLDCLHEGTVLNGLVAVPAGAGPFPAVLVMHNALGIGPQVRQVAAKLVARGFLAVVCDMYGGGQAAADPQAAGQAYAALLQTPSFLRERVVAWFQTVVALSAVDPARIAAIGYCFGGQCVLELARSGVDLRLAVSFHGLLKTTAPAQPGTVKGRVLAWCGGQDPFAPAQDIAGLRSELVGAGVENEVVVFESAAHAFTDPDAARMGRPGIAYDEAADRASWVGTLAALDVGLNI